MLDNKNLTAVKRNVESLLREGKILKEEKGIVLTLRVMKNNSNSLKLESLELNN